MVVVGVALALATSAVVISTNGVASASTGSKIPASAFSDHTGITKTEVKLANVSTLTIGLFKGADVGAQAYADYVNSTGGVNGRKLVLTDFDDQFGGAGNKQATQNAIENDFAMVGNFSLEDSYGGALLKADPGVPDVSVVLDPGTNKLPNVFSAVPLNAGWEEGAFQFLKTKYPKDIHAVGAMVAGLPSAEQDWAGEKYAMGKAGYKVIYDPTYTVSSDRLHPERHRHEERRRQDGLHGLHGRELWSVVPEGPGPAGLPPGGGSRCRFLYQLPGQGRRRGGGDQR